MTDRPLQPGSTKIQSPDDEIDLLAIARTLWVGRWRIAGVTALSLAAGAFHALDQTPIYRADGLLQLEEKRSALALPSGMKDLFAQETAPMTELAIIRSRMVLGRVVDELGLDILAEPLRLPGVGGIVQRIGLPRPPGLPVLTPYAWDTEAIEVGELEIPRGWLGQRLTVTALDRERYRVALPDGTTRVGALRTRVADARVGFSLRIDRLEAEPGRVFHVLRQPRDSAIAALRSSVSVSESTRGSSILRLEVTSPDRERAVRILDSVARTYLEQNVDRSAAEAQRSLEFIESQLPAARDEVQAAEAALNSYRQQARSVDLSFETQALLERASRLEEELTRLALEEDALADRYTRSHPTYQALLRKRSQIEADLAALREDAGGLPETQKEIFNLTRNLEVSQQIYFQFLNRMQELQVLRASTIGSVRVIDKAQADRLPIEPRKSRILALFGLLGLGLGGAWVMIARSLRKGIRGSEDLERMGLPVFATVPFTPAIEAIHRRRGMIPILALSEPENPAIEGLRSLRTALHFGMMDAQSKALLITSGAPEAGKSFTAANLAVVCAQGGQRVCLIDADLRRGYLRRFFGLERETLGLSDYLSGQASLKEVLHKGPVPSLCFIPSGKFPPNPSEVLMRSALGDLIELLGSELDLIIIDSAPALAVTDPVILGRKAGAVIMIARHLTTLPGEVEALRNVFETAGLRVTGAVLNGWRLDDASRYGSHYGAYYNYRYSYKRDERE
jgi:tyrosine-protein kinase Etk/Wzc